MVVIEVYLDESGTDHDSQILSVSAVWASKEDWQIWTLEWIVAKAPIKIHHSVDCHNRHGEYEGWTREERDRHVKRILPVVKNHYIRGIIAAVDRRKLSEVLAHKHSLAIKPEDMVRGWYYICLQWALRSTWEKLASEGHDNIAFVHEANQYSAAATEAFQQVQRHFPGKSATFNFGSKTRHPPLQCADVLAYEGNHQMRNFRGPLRKTLQAIDPSFSRFSFRKYDDEEVDQIADFTAQYLRRVASELASG
ncbi:DUF3800 domain-containing protein [Mesorhizobium sp. M0904]|uniref:DUF3800 domain-containing protein n=1 Tax=unclassified Mesorhizobium TaxID=325217 RepID=UPI00333B4569